jgi:hypothetical protein
VTSGGLRHPVANRGHGEEPEAAIALSHLEAEQWERMVAPAHQAPLETIDLHLPIGGEVGDRHAVRTMAAAVVAHSFECRHERLSRRELLEHR